MRQIHLPFIVAALLVFAGCRPAPEPAPAQALAGYIDAVRGHRCDVAMTFLSARSRYAIAALIERPERPQLSIPIEHYYCYDLMFEHCKAKEMTVAAEQGDTAKVSMPCGRTQDSILPGFTSMFLKYEPRITDLVREEGAWRIVLPMPIRIVEIRERDEQLREEALRDHERRRQQYQAGR